MPQTDHIMINLPKSQSNHQLSQDVSNSPAISHKSHHSCLSTHNSSIASSRTKRSPAVAKKPIIKERKDEKTSDFSFSRELQLSALVLICFVVGLAIPVAMAAIGGVYLFSCPRNVMIPVFLLVCGTTFLMSVFGLRKLNSRSVTEQDHLCYKACLRSSVLLQIAWFAAGCFWVYGAYEPDYNTETNANYCSKSLYLFAFWLLNSIFISLGIVIMAFIGFVICGRQSSSSPVNV